MIYGSLGESNEKTYTLLSLFWVIPLELIIMFYFLFPVQLIWVVIFAPFGFVLGLMSGE